MSSMSIIKSGKKLISTPLKWLKLKTKKLIEMLNPAVDKKYLVFIAGLMWCGVGIMLISFAVTWLNQFKGNGTILYYSAGFIAAIPIHIWGFLRLAEKNINRILPLRGKRCIFSFITWKSYIIVIIMISMGITLRHSSIPKQYLSMLYNGIGLGLFLSGVVYLRQAFKLINH
jgi:hypothetical protein